MTHKIISRETACLKYASRLIAEYLKIATNAIEDWRALTAAEEAERTWILIKLELMRDVQTTAIK